MGAIGVLPMTVPHRREGLPRGKHIAGACVGRQFFIRLMMHMGWFFPGVPLKGGGKNPGRHQGDARSIGSPTEMHNIY